MSRLTLDDLLDLLIEEAAEVIHAASKVKRFGWNRTEPGYGHNGKQLAAEIGDLLGVIDGLSLESTIVVARQRQKLAKAQAVKDRIEQEHAAKKAVL